MKVERKFGLPELIRIITSVPCLHYWLNTYDWTHITHMRAAFGSKSTLKNIFVIGLEIRLITGWLWFNHN